MMTLDEYEIVKGPFDRDGAAAIILRANGNDSLWHTNAFGKLWLVLLPERPNSEQREFIKKSDGWYGRSADGKFEHESYGQDHLLHQIHFRLEPMLTTIRANMGPENVAKLL
jgi:hypothetical protein